MGPCLRLAECSCKQHEKQKSKKPSDSDMERQTFEVAKANHHRYAPQDLHKERLQSEYLTITPMDNDTRMSAKSLFEHGPHEYFLVLGQSGFQTMAG